MGTSSAALTQPLTFLIVVLITDSKWRWLREKSMPFPLCYIFLMVHEATGICLYQMVQRRNGELLTKTLTLSLLLVAVLRVVLAIGLVVGLPLFVAGGYGLTHM